MKHTKVFSGYMKHVRRFLHLVIALLCIQLITHIIFIILQVHITVGTITLPLFFSGLITFISSAMMVMALYYQKTLPRQLKREEQNRSFQ
jgi:hypothetical protein